MMMTCPDCSSACSDRAAACPHCGCPLRQRSLWTREMGVAGAVYALLIVSGIVMMPLMPAGYLRGMGLMLALMGAVLLVVRVLTAK